MKYYWRVKNEWQGSSLSVCANHGGKAEQSFFPFWAQFILHSTPARYSVPARLSFFLLLTFSIKKKYGNMPNDIVWLVSSNTKYSYVCHAFKHLKLSENQFFISFWICSIVDLYLLWSSPWIKKIINHISVSPNKQIQNKQTKIIRNLVETKVQYLTKKKWIWWVSFSKQQQKYIEK